MPVESAAARRLLSPSQVLHLGRFELHPAERQLRRDGQPLALGARPLDILLVLARHRERPVSKAELIEAVWPEQDVEEGNLSVHISALRKLLGPQAITTVPGCGYRIGLAPPGDNRPRLHTAPDWAAAPRFDLPRPPAGPLSNLPAPGLPLIGRTRELALLGAELGPGRLLSLVGPGGIGKTRLAQEAAARHLAEQAPADGVWWVDAAELADGAELLQRLMRTLQLSAPRAASPLDALCRALQRQALLIVLDNAEHLVAQAAPIVQAVLEACPQVGWLLTSQEPLKLPAERITRLDGLAVPPPGTPLDQALEHGALALLIGRAQAADRRFTLAPGQLDAAIRLCRDLDGVALAIEMAAARLPWLGLEGVCSRLDERFRLLASDRRLGAARHRSLQAALDWSHGLLSALEQQVLRQLAVFRGGFTPELAQAVIAPPAEPQPGDEPSSPAISPWDVLDALGSLVDKSLVQVSASRADEGSATPGGPRLHLLETTRLYAQLRLDEAGELASTQRRHAQALADWAEAAGQRLWVDSDRVWLACHEAELDNLRAALAWAMAEQDAALVAPLYEWLGWLGIVLMGGVDTRRWADAVEALARARPHPPQIEGRLLLAAGSHHRHSAPLRAGALYRQAADALASAGDDVRRFRALAGLVRFAAFLGHFDEAQDFLAQAQALNQTDWPARQRMFLEEAGGMLAMFQGDPRLSREHYRRYQRLVEAAGAEGALAVVFSNLADIALCLGELDEAVDIGRRHVAHLRSQRGQRNRFNLGFALGNLCAARVARGDLEEAEAAGREALPLLRPEDYAAWLFDHFALLAARRGHFRLAALLAGHASAARARTQTPREPNEATAWQQALALSAQALGPQEQPHWLERGALLSDAQADRLVFANDDAILFQDAIHPGPPSP